MLYQENLLLPTRGGNLMYKDIDKISIDKFTAVRCLMKLEMFK